MIGKRPAERPAHTRSRMFWSMTAAFMILRLGCSWYDLVSHGYFFTLSAEDIARIRLALVWADQRVFFPDEGFALQYGHSAWMTPCHLTRTYVEVSPLYLWFIQEVCI